MLSYMSHHYSEHHLRGTFLDVYSLYSILLYNQIIDILYTRCIRHSTFSSMTFGNSSKGDVAQGRGGV